MSKQLPVDLQSCAPILLFSVGIPLPSVVSPCFGESTPPCDLHLYVVVPPSGIVFPPPCVVAPSSGVVAPPSGVVAPPSGVVAPPSCVAAPPSGVVFHLPDVVVGHAVFLLVAVSCLFLLSCPLVAFSFLILFALDISILYEN